MEALCSLSILGVGADSAIGRLQQEYRLTVCVRGMIEELLPRPILIVYRERASSESIPVTIVYQLDQLRADAKGGSASLARTPVDQPKSQMFLSLKRTRIWLIPW